MESPEEEVRGLHPETERRLRELFAGRVCCRCGAPARRIRGREFYCPDHFEQASGRGALGPRPRVYRSAAGRRG